MAEINHNSEIENQDSTFNSSTEETVDAPADINQDPTVSSSAEETSDDSSNDITSAETPNTASATNNLSTAERDEQNSDDVTSSDEDEDSIDHNEVEDEFYGIPVKDYDEMNLDALGEELERLLRAHEVKHIRQHVREIKMEFDAKFDQKHTLEKEKFLAEGGNIIDFSYSIPAEIKFNKLYFEYKEKRDNYYKKVRKNLQENLARRLSIIEELKAITGVGNDMNANFSAFKQIQERWKKAGPVPRNDYKDTWNTYHHHVERFYDFLHLDREFREMDYKHNLEQKLKMVARAEELAQDKDINRAFRELQNLHRMWKEDVGPVAQEYSDAIWEKFSAATKQIHENRRNYFAERDQEREKHLQHKQELIEQIEALTKKQLKSHHQVQKAIKAFQELRDQFFKAGKVPQKDNQSIWDDFKAATRDFNHKKNDFYKARKRDHKLNYEKKLELVKIAEDNKDSDDFETVTPLMKKIQSDWKKIGYVQRNKSDKIWARFKKACNHYFDRLHQSQDKKDQAALEVYNQKVELLEATEQLELSGNRDTDLPKIKAQIEAWKQLGRVPRNKKNIESKFTKVLDSLFAKLDMNKSEAEMLKYENRLQALEEADDDNQIRREAAFLYKKIDQTKDEIRQLETNLQFFSNANKDNPLLKDSYKKIDRLKQQLKTWKAKLNKLKQI